MISLSRSTMIRVNAGEVLEMSAADAKGVGIRILKAGSMGYAYSTDFRPSSLEVTLQEAVALADSADPDEFQALPQVEGSLAPDQDLDLYDEQLAERSTEDKVAFILGVERAALNHDPRVVATSQCSYHDSVSRLYLANSHGFVGYHEGTGAVAYLRAMARDNGGQTAGLGLGCSVFYRDLDAEAIGREASTKAVQLLGGAPVRTQTASVVLDPFAGVEFLTFVAQALTAESVQRGRSFLMGKLGEQIASQGVNLVDDGRLVRGLGSASFDGEGVPTSRTLLVVDGTLERLLYDTYTARRDGTASTGNAQRSSYRGLPHPAPTNLFLLPSSKAVEQVIAGVGKGLYVTHTMNTGGINPVNGDYSVGASGLWVENGEIMGPVTGVTVAGNMVDMLHEIGDVAEDLRFIPISHSIGAPTFVVEGMTIGGG
jgi:PmbA protein